VLLKQKKNHFWQALDEDGFIAPGQIIRNHDIYVNKQTPKVATTAPGTVLTSRWVFLCLCDSIFGAPFSSLLAHIFGFKEWYMCFIVEYYLSRDYRDSPAVYKGVDGETTVVDRVMLCSDTDDKLTIKCIIRHTRRPEVLT
jgi:DNA-directed RNA polymerase III subunit RPC2